MPAENTASAAEGILGLSQITVKGTRIRMIPATETLMIDGQTGSLEALLEYPRDGGPVGCAVLCHPHPVHGGTMQNKVVHTLSRSFVALEFASLRFNFRGVGQSDGEFDEGIGEIDDVLAAVLWLRNRYNDIPLWLGGFSFGAAMAIHAAVAAPVRGLVCVAPALYRFAGKQQQQPDCPWLIVQGDKDELVDINETIEYVNKLEPGPQLAVFPGGEHFFHGRLIELRDTVEEFIRVNVASG